MLRVDVCVQHLLFWGQQMPGNKCPLAARSCDAARPLSSDSQWLKTAPLIHAIPSYRAQQVRAGKGCTMLCCNHVLFHSFHEATFHNNPPIMMSILKLYCTIVSLMISNYLP